MHCVPTFARARYLQMLGLAILAMLLATASTSAAGRPDGVIRDCSADAGAEPNNACGDFYRSSDIVVRNTVGYSPIHQQPITGQTNWIYVTVTNIGSSSLTDGVVHVYFAKASTGLIWSSSWINDVIAGIVYGDEIGSATVPALAPHTSINVEIPWNTVPNPNDFNDPDARHFCLLARLVSQQDPMSFTEGPSIPVNTQNNNNIAWKNISVMDATNSHGALDVAREPKGGTTQLQFIVPNDEREDPVLRHCQIKVDLGAALMDRWKATGEKGAGVIDAQEANTIEITDADAWIGGLDLAADTRYTIHVQVIYPDEVNPDIAGKTYHWNVAQIDEDGNTLVGGEGYDIAMPNDPNRRPDVMIKDCFSDVGHQPNNDCGVFYASPDIWVRNAQGAVPGHQQPITGQPNWVYVTVKNIGGATLNTGVVHLYFAKASTGLTWSTSWINDLLPSCVGPGNTLYGDEIGTVVVNNLLPGASRDLEFLWNTVPNPNDFCDWDAHHFCLLARFVSAEDPMPFPEGISVPANTQNNNNIAWKNVSVINSTNPNGAVDVRKDPSLAGPTKLKFDVPEDEMEDNVLRHCQIKVDLGADLMQRWEAAGGEGEGITVTDEPNVIAINDVHAWIGAIQLPDDVRNTIHVRIEYPADIPEDVAGRTFHWNLEQVNGDADAEVLAGGEQYEVTMPGDPAHRPDVLIKDCLSDVGNQPNTDCGYFYASPDIWVRNTQGAVPGHQQPITGQPNWVYVTVTNISSTTLGHGVTHLYFAKASTGLSWSASWINNILAGCTGPTVFGDEIGTVDVYNLLPGETRDLEFLWNTVPNPGDFCDWDARHFCLLARFVSAEDPMAFPEVASIQDNTRNNNNIAWKNVSIMNSTNPHGAVDVQRDLTWDGATELKFDVPDGDGDDNVLQHCKIKVDLGNELAAAWEAAGNPGEGIERTEEPNTIAINATHARIGGLQLPDDRRHTIHVAIEYPADFDQAVAGRTYHWTIAQHNEGQEQPVGGEQYDITMPDGPGKMVLPNGDADLSAILKLAAHPNPTAAGTTIGFTMPTAGHVSVAIYDASGRQVCELLTNAERSAGQQQVIWNGESASGKRVPSGTYLCRLTTPSGSVEQQIKIVR